MSKVFPCLITKTRHLLATLARDTGANVLMIVAASIFPLLALVGSGIDMGRGYMAETRLQQACDAGTLSARKRLGTAAAVTGVIPDSAADSGQRFFNLNFRNGAYGSSNRQFQMVLESDMTITGTASADVDTTIMRAFGFEIIPVSVTCSAQINMSNTDVMMVLDTTGSMLETNPGDTVSRIDALRNTVRSFYAQMEANKAAGTRIRYGFVPYSTNVNVGGLLQPEWLVNQWHYNFKEARPTGLSHEEDVFEDKWVEVSGDVTYGTTVYGGTCPVNDYNNQFLGQTTNADGWDIFDYLETGTQHNCNTADGTVSYTPWTFNDHHYQYWRRKTGTRTVNEANWHYDSFPVDLSFLSTTNQINFRIGGYADDPYDIEAYYRGCVEERDTYDITDYSHVDLSRALDLDIDRVPEAGNPATQWRPMLNELSWVREMQTSNFGRFTPGPVDSPMNYVNAFWWGFGACPSPAQKLQEMTADQVSTYVDGLVAQGSTYHDIGMIWGGRLLSPTGLFASENGDIAGASTSRHMIFLTDGQTEPLDVSYTTYGIEPLDQRRWSPSSTFTLPQTIENRFSFACREVKRRNIQVWVISFGTAANPIMRNCAGPGHYFVANRASELEATFSDIARRMGGLRLVR